MRTQESGRLQGKVAGLRVSAARALNGNSSLQPMRQNMFCFWRCMNCGTLLVQHLQRTVCICRKGCAVMWTRVQIGWAGWNYRVAMAGSGRRAESIDWCYLGEMKIHSRILYEQGMGWVRMRRWFDLEVMDLVVRLADAASCLLHRTSDIERLRG